MSRESITYEVQIWVEHPNGLEWMNGWRFLGGFDDLSTAVAVMNFLPIKSKKLKRVIKSTYTEQEISESIAIIKPDSHF
jgi:hypothetical protein